MLAGSFPAREVIVSTLGIIYSLGGDVDEEDEGLRQALQQAQWPDGRPVYTLPVALSHHGLLCPLCSMCRDADGHTPRNHSWTWPAFTFFYMTGLAYIFAWLVYQIGTAWMSGT